MKNYLRRQVCDQCGNEYDSEWVNCPNCGCPSREATKQFSNFAHIKTRDQLLYFLIGFIGFQLIGLVMSIIIVLLAWAGNPSLLDDDAAYLEFVNSATMSFWTNIGSYLVLGIIFGIFIVVFKTHGEIFRTFASKKILWGFAIFGLILAAEEFYSIIISLIYQASGRELAGDNANQNAIYGIISYSSFGSILVIGFLAPFLEELTYRVGLFSLSCRVNKIFGYIVTILVFAFLHFDFTGDMETELINLPLYLMAAAGLTFAYDKFGLGASTLAHCCNNVLSILIYIGQGA